MSTEDIAQKLISQILREAAADQSVRLYVVRIGKGYRKVVPAKVKGKYLKQVVATAREATRFALYQARMEARSCLGKVERVE